MRLLAGAAAGLALHMSGLAADPAAGGIMLLSTQGSERATTGLGNKIVTIGERTHAVWLDVNATGYWARVSTLNRTNGQWSKTVTLGKAFDNHSRPTIAADRDGILHVIISGHNTPYLYTKSARPNDASEWTKPVPVFKGTYPSLVAGPDGSLWLSGRPPTLNGVDLFCKTNNGNWKPVFPLAYKRDPKYKGYGGYNSILAWGPGHRRLHFACDIYEGPNDKLRGMHQAIVYMVSDDRGLTWKRGNGTPIEGEHFGTNLDVVADSLQNRGVIKSNPVLRLGGLVVDDQDRPYILYSGDEPVAGEARLVTPAEGGGWTELGLAAALRQHDPEWGALGPAGAFTRTEAGVLQMCIPLAPLAGMKNPADKEVKPDSIRYVWIESADGGKTYTFKAPVPGGDGIGRFAPSLERPSGGNAVAAKGNGTGLLFFSGLHRYAKPGEVIQNRVYFTEVK